MYISSFATFAFAVLNTTPKKNEAKAAEEKT